MTTADIRYKFKSLVGGRLSLRLLGAFFMIVLILAAVGMTVTIRITTQRLEARAESQLTNDEAIVRLIFDELEENITRYSQLLASTETLTEELAEPSTSRSLTIYLLSDLRRHEMSVRLFKQGPPDTHPASALIQKGFLGVRTIGLIKTSTEHSWVASIDSVAPIETSKGVDQVVKVAFPLNAAFLARIRNHTGSDITLVFPNKHTISTLPKKASSHLVERLWKLGLGEGKSLDEPFTLATNSVAGQAKTLVTPFRVNLKHEGLILFTMPMSDLLAAKKTIFFKGLISTLIILSAASLLYIWLIRRITKPLEELSEATHHISKGNLDLQVKVKTHDEVGELASSFNDMVRRLKESRNEIEEWNRTLEKRVEERTHSLQRTQSELKGVNEQLVKALTELREAQDKMIHTEKMAALGQMASTIAHEIHNPLAGMRGALEVVLKDQPDESYAGVLKKVLEQIDRLSQTTTRLLSFARPAKPQQQPTDLEDLIDKTKLFVDDQARRRGVEIVLELESMDRPILVDPQLTNQVFLNIALNAIQAMDDGGTLTISSSVDPDDKSVSINFSDTGKGMSSEVLDKAFYPFFTTKRSGTGLGLYVVKDIVEQQGGTVTVSSTPGKGTVVTVKLPAREDASLESSA